MDDRGLASALSACLPITEVYNMTLRITQYERGTNICVNDHMCECNTLQECFDEIDSYADSFDMDDYYIHYFISTYTGGKENG